MAACPTLVLRHFCHVGNIVPECCQRNCDVRLRAAVTGFKGICLQYFQMLRCFKRSISSPNVSIFMIKSPPETFCFSPQYLFILRCFLPGRKKKSAKSGFLFRFRSRFFCVFSYSFTAPSVIPVTKYFCRNGYTISIGTRAINTFAASSDLLEFCANC